MALPLLTDVQAAVATIYNALAEDKVQKFKAKSGVAALGEVKAALEEAYGQAIDFGATDVADFDGVQA